MEFKKYQHVERLGTSEVDGILNGEVYIFPKIDGTNSSVWIDNFGIIQCGSRNRQLTLENDNAGFCNFVNSQDAIIRCLKENPKLRLYGEWLVPHTIKTYADNAWRKFYVFDVMLECDKGNEEYIPYSEYVEILEKYNIDYIPLLGKIENPTYDSICDFVDKNSFLIKSGMGNGEGVVVKNYNYKNKWGNIVWAKVVSSEFKNGNTNKSVNKQLKNTSEICIELEIINKYVTLALCEKVKAKIIEEKGDWSSKYIPMLLNMVFYDLINEECWHFIKEFKNPNVNFKRLMSMCYSEVKNKLNL